MKCVFVQKKKRKCLLLLNRNWFSSCPRESPAARDFATVLRDACRPYVLQMRRNELKYGFNCQNPAGFPRIYLSILHKQALPASNSVDRQNFMVESFKSPFNIWNSLPLKGSSCIMHFLKPQFLYFSSIYDSNDVWPAEISKSRDYITDLI